jgi:hypothetical protein
MEVNSMQVTRKIRATIFMFAVLCGEIDIHAGNIYINLS